MLKNIKEHNDPHQLLVSLLSTSGTLAGISLALVGIIHLKLAEYEIETIADDMFLFSSLGFLIVCYLIFFTLRQINSTKAQYWMNAIDAVFLCSMTLLVVAGFVVVYTFL